MKKIVAIVMILLLLVAGGLGGSAVLGYGPLAPLFKATMKKPEEPPPEAPTAKHKVLELGAYIIPIVEKHEIRRQVEISLQVDVSEEKADLANLSMPRLISAVRIKLFDLVPLYPDPKSKGGRQAIRDQLDRELTQMLGEGAVLDVTIKGMYVR